MKTSKPFIMKNSLGMLVIHNEQSNILFILSITLTKLTMQFIERLSDHNLYFQPQRGNSTLKIYCNQTLIDAISEN